MTMASTGQPEMVQASSDQVICTLYEGDYHLGVAVLINSIVRGGFRGLFWVGYRGELPPWVAQLPKRDDGLYPVGEALLGFELLDSAVHFTHFKPAFMNSVIGRGIASKSIWYFDPDVTVRCEWQFFERWIRFGVCLCQDITLGVMPSNDPLRSEWIEAVRKAGWNKTLRQQERYYNGGFIGLGIEHKGFLDLWAAGNALARSAGVDQAKFHTGSRANTFYFADQDALNIAAMFSDAPLSTVGPEGMGFVDGGFTMYHSVGGAKPWRKKFLRSAMKGVPPWNGDKHFLECADDGPVRPYSDSRLKAKRRWAALASLIGRFYQRG